MRVHSNEGYKIHCIHAVRLHSNPISHWIKGLCCHLTALGGCKDTSWAPSTSVLPSFCPSYPLNPAVVSRIKPAIQFTYHIQLWAHGVLSGSATMTCKITYSVKGGMKMRKNEKWFLLHFIFIHYHGTSWLSNVRSVKLYSQSSAGWINAWGSSSPTGSGWGQRAALINILHTALEAIWPYIHYEHR